MNEERLHPLDGIAHARIDEGVNLVDSIKGMDLKDFHVFSSDTRLRGFLGEDQKVKRVVEVRVTLRSEL